ncbi:MULTISPECIES: hypothetical protein [unclassified Rhizobium]|uniref:hypothetical protein n=1 Tax=unclassified Rhizobium TaxID=2613769 RepID=UPI0006F1C6B5|nr:MULTISPECIES: hypothetical protein [unclassified Rhizobium]KQV40763.1 hypothetical protein ASC86_20975 [Rhizobium sp. Root1212]KRD36051.1 hypothetical protein ASE37_20265 [Rhizobium sp. Root268]
MTTTLVATDLKLLASGLIRTGCELPDVVRMLRDAVNEVHFLWHADRADRARGQSLLLLPDARDLAWGAPRWRPMRLSLLRCDAEGDCFAAH